MPLLNGSPLAIPDSADLERAWQETIDPPSPAPGLGFSRTTPGETFEQLLAASLSVTTSATVINRLFFVIIQDANGVNAAAFPAAAVQGASIQAGYNITAGIGQTLALPNNAYSIAIPPFLLLPGFKVLFTSPQLQPGDQLSGISLTYLRIPTGRQQESAEPLLSTPLAV